MKRQVGRSPAFKNSKLKKFSHSLFWISQFSAIFKKSPAALIPGHLTLREGFALAHLSSTLKRGAHIVELGSYLGRSASFLLAGLKHNATLTCIDTWQNEGMSEGIRDTYPCFIQNMRPYDGEYFAIKGKTEVVAREWTTNIDLLFIDADHSYEGCIADCKNWIPFVNPAGWICMHDYFNDPGVQKATEEYLPDKIFKYFFVDSMLVARKIALKS